MASFSGIMVVVILVCFQGTNEEFFEECGVYKCSTILVRYPLFQLENHNDNCSKTDFKLSCSGSTTVLKLNSGTYNVTRIDYKLSLIYIALQPWSACLEPNMTLPDLSDTPYNYSDQYNVWINCSTILPTNDANIMGPISCLSDKENFIYLVSGTERLDEFKSCTKFASSNLAWSMPESLSQPDVLEAYLSWDTNGIPGNCSKCELVEWCGLTPERNQTFCYVMIDHLSHVPRISIRTITPFTGVVIGIMVIIVVGVPLGLYHKNKRTKELRRRVEHFIKSYNATSPTRYTYSDIIKITKRFQTKLGQGGFGVVFKGLLPNEIPVAVKILKISDGNGDEFINEVSTIGKIHHFNIVRLLGFCSEGTRRALVYELMENGSLDKYIFYKQLGQMRQRKFDLQVLQNMVISIAEGINYLHQGCNQRIVHLDIKPHNILLDHNFNPKISDFGHSKICPKDQSYVTVSAARGTLSYMAPEMYSRNFGVVSHKSDVYSFGMLILEMVSGRRNNDPLTGEQSDVYFPELIYEQLIQGENLHMILDLQNDDMIASQKLVTVALWCIQGSPTDRPTMSRVINMLKGEGESLPIPPKPRIS